MKIKEIKIQNFKSLKNIEIDNLLDVNMVYGYNNSGKSNLLKFLEMAFWAPEFELEIPIEVSGTRNIEKQKRKDNFWRKTILNHPFIFRKESDKYFDISFSITLEIDKDFLNTSLGVNNKIVKEFFKGGESSLDLIYEGGIQRTGNYQAQQSTKKILFNKKVIFNVDGTGAEIIFPGSKALNFNDFESFMKLFNDCVLLLDNDRYFINEKEENEEKDLSSKNFKNKMFSLSLAYLKDSEYNELNTFLKSFVISSEDKVFSNNEMSSPFKNFKFEFIREGNEIEILLTNDFGKFPLSSFGTGIQQIIFILTKIFLSQKQIILIEEIELNLSPKYQLEIIDFISKKLIKEKISSQLFYTTHSPLMCYRSEFRSLQARIDANGISSILQISPSKDDVGKFKDAMKLLEHYHPNVKPIITTSHSTAKKPAKKKAAKRK